MEVGPARDDPLEEARLCVVGADEVAAAAVVATMIAVEADEVVLFAKVEAGFEEAGGVGLDERPDLLGGEVEVDGDAEHVGKHVRVCVQGTRAVCRKWEGDRCWDLEERVVDDDGVVWVAWFGGERHDVVGD